MEKIIKKFLNEVNNRNQNEPEFMQAVSEVAETVIPYIVNNDIYYGPIINKQGFNKIKEYELEATLQLENDVALAFADIEYNGLEFDQELKKTHHQKKIQQLFHTEESKVRLEL